MPKRIQKRLVLMGDSDVGPYGMTFLFIMTQKLEISLEKTALLRSFLVPEFVLSPRVSPFHLRPDLRTRTFENVQQMLNQFTYRTHYRDISTILCNMSGMSKARLSIWADRESFEHAEQKWLPEIQHFRPGIPVILVACKVYLRINMNLAEQMERRWDLLISREEGDTMAQRMGAKIYIKCSTMTRTNVDEVFQKAAFIANSFPLSKVK
ncbi:11956_t:CDS:2 [Acaulospora colombiana]|uniref:11956_t:CDS:1 n=1 Tax=Acaulospora colombiana TaxID=27376 RepID=A0ACA9QIP2_9GLOM|nr:11956_t:CDS:2 [Acaulospora colombiana]